MAVSNWVLFVLVAPVLLLVPGYLVLQIAARGRSEVLDVEATWETVGLSVALSLSLIVLLGFALAQTVGLTRVSVLVAYVLLFVGLGAILVSSGAWQGDRASASLPSPGSGDSLSSAWLVGASLLVLLLGVGLFEAAEPYSEAYYANASGVGSPESVTAGEQAAWTIVVENHEKQATTYTIETRLIPEDVENQTRTSGRLADRAQLDLADGQRGNHTVELTVPDCCIWKAKTYVQPEGGEELAVHRWLRVWPQ